MTISDYDAEELAAKLLGFADVAEQCWIARVDA